MSKPALGSTRIILDPKTGEHYISIADFSLWLKNDVGEKLDQAVENKNPIPSVQLHRFLMGELVELWADRSKVKIMEFNLSSKESSAAYFADMEPDDNSNS